MSFTQEWINFKFSGIFKLASFSNIRVLMFRFTNYTVEYYSNLCPLCYFPIAYSVCVCVCLVTQNVTVMIAQRLEAIYQIYILAKRNESLNDI